MDPLKEEHAGDRTLSTSPALLSPSPGAHRKSPLRERIEAELSSLTAGLEVERAENARYVRTFVGIDTFVLWPTEPKPIHTEKQKAALCVFCSLFTALGRFVDCSAVVLCICVLFHSLR